MPHSATKPIAVAIFDVDGTLCDTNYIHALCWHRALRQSENEIVPMAKLHSLIGIGSDQLTTKAIGRHSKAATEAHSKIYEQHWDEVTAFEAIPELFAALDKAGVKIVLASSAEGRELEMLRGTIDCEEFIASSTSNSDVEHSKPEADIFATALQTAGAPSDQAIVIGDSVWDMIAAKKAGITGYGVSTGGIAPQIVKDAGAKEVFENLKELHERLDEILGN